LALNVIAITALGCYVRYKHTSECECADQTNQHSSHVHDNLLSLPDVVDITSRAIATRDRSNRYLSSRPP
jgi:hypothetical protein